jgi:EpsI family protein
VFFGLLIFAMMTIGRIWSEDHSQVPVGPRPPAEAGGDGGVERPGGRRQMLLTLMLALFVTQVWPLLARIAAIPVPYASPTAQAPRLPAPWTPVAYTFAPAWTPSFVGDRDLLHASFRGNGGTVGWYVAWFGAQRQGSEVVNAANHLIHEKYAPWRIFSTGVDAQVNLPSRTVLRTHMRERGGSQEILVWQWYWIAGHATASRLAAKVYECVARLSGAGSPGASIVFYAVPGPDETADAAEARLHAFAVDASSALHEMLSDVPRTVPGESP